MKLEIISKHPIESQHPTPLLFIHGMMHGAWCWDVHFLDYFAQHGFAAYAANLRGVGSGMAVLPSPDPATLAPGLAHA